MVGTRNKPHSKQRRMKTLLKPHFKLRRWEFEHLVALMETRALECYQSSQVADKLIAAVLIGQASRLRPQMLRVRQEHSLRFSEVQALAFIAAFKEWQPGGKLEECSPMLVQHIFSRLSQCLELTTL